MGGIKPHQRSAKGQVAFAPASGVYHAWGGSATELPTDFTFTGQREAAEIGLKYYVARWYDSEIGHFIQADIVVPGIGNPMAWNRYAYVKYNPVRYVGPSGYNSILPPNYNYLMTDGGNNQHKTAKIEFRTYKTTSPVTESNSSIYRSGTWFVSVQFGPDHCFIVDYCADTPTTYEEGEIIRGMPLTLPAIIDFLTIAAPLIPPEKAGNDTWIRLDYTLNGDVFSIDSVTVMTSIHGEGSLFFNGFDLKSGAYGETVGYPSNIKIPPRGPINILDHPISASSKTTLNLTMHFNCINCYAGASRWLAFNLNILMGDFSVNYDDIGEPLVP